MNSDPNEEWEFKTPFEEWLLRVVYYFNPYIYGLHPERKLLRDSFVHFLNCKIDEKMEQKIAIRKRHEYFLYVHVSNNYHEGHVYFVSETLWKAKQFQFRAATDADFGYYDKFKEGMNKYMKDSKGILPEEELKDIQKFYENAKPQQFLILEPLTGKLVRYNAQTTRRLQVFLRDHTFNPDFGTNYIGITPFDEGDEDDDDVDDRKHQWYIQLLNGRE